MPPPVACSTFQVSTSAWVRGPLGGPGTPGRVEDGPSQMCGVRPRRAVLPGLELGTLEI